MSRAAFGGDGAPDEGFFCRESFFASLSLAGLYFFFWLVDFVCAFSLALNHFLHQAGAKAIIPV